MSEEDIKLYDYQPEDMMRLLKNTDCAESARLKHLAGPAISIFYKNELVACAGIQHEGVGEGWLILSENAKNEHPIITINSSKDIFDFIMRKYKFWHIWAETSNEIKDKLFLEHLNFRKVEAFLRG